MCGNAAGGHCGGVGNGGKRRVAWVWSLCGPESAWLWYLCVCKVSTIRRERRLRLDIASFMCIRSPKLSLPSFGRMLEVEMATRLAVVLRLEAESVVLGWYV